MSRAADEHQSQNGVGVAGWLRRLGPSRSGRGASRLAPGDLPPLLPWSHADPLGSGPSCGGSPFEVAVLVYRGVSSSEVELVGEALARPLGAAVRLVSADPGLVVGVEPARAILTEPLSAVPEPFGVVVPGGLAWKREAARPEVAAWLLEVTNLARGVLAVSTGSLLLASVGALDDQEATGHWLAGDLLAGLGARPSGARIVHGRLVATATGARSGSEAAAELAKKMLFAPR